MEFKELVDTLAKRSVFRLFQLRVTRQHFLRFRLRLLQHAHVRREISNVHVRETMLSGAKEIAWSAQT